MRNLTPEIEQLLAAAWRQLEVFVAEMSQYEREVALVPV